MTSSLAAVLIPNAYLGGEQQRLLKGPEPLGMLVAQHARKILDAGYGQLSERDTFHGHLLARDGAACDSRKFHGFDALVGDIEMIMYHTREWLHDWVPGSNSNVPRSICGLPNGDLALPYPPDGENIQKYYADYGTIFPDAPFAIGNRAYHLKQPRGRFAVNGRADALCFFAGDIWFRQEKSGRFGISEAEPLEVYLGVFLLLETYQAHF